MPGVQNFTFSLSTRLHQLLEDHLESLCAEDVEEGAEDHQAWDNWLVESGSDSSSEGSEWIDVEPDGSNNFEISDSDSEITDRGPGSARPDQHKQASMGVTSLATTKVRNVLLPIRNSD